MNLQLFRNNARTIVSSYLLANAEEIHLKDASKFPGVSNGDFYFATIQEGTKLEIVRVTYKSGNTLYVERGWDNTVPLAFAPGAKFEMRLNAWTLKDFLNRIVSLENIMNTKAAILSPFLKGIPSTTMPADNDESLRIAPTAWVMDRIRENIVNQSATNYANKLIIVTNRTFTAPKDGTYHLQIIGGGGCGGFAYINANRLPVSGKDGLAGQVVTADVTLTAGQTVVCAIGAGGFAQYTHDGNKYRQSGEPIMTVIDNGTGQGQSSMFGALGTAAGGPPGYSVVGDKSNGTIYGTGGAGAIITNTYLDPYATYYFAPNNVFLAGHSGYSGAIIVSWD